jgi:hypothetical protein
MGYQKPGSSLILLFFAVVPSEQPLEASVGEEAKDRNLSPVVRKISKLRDRVCDLNALNI